MKPSLEQAVAAFDAAPAPIQQALTNGVAITFIMQLADRYRLHIDVEGEITELIRNMLLGFIKPTDFIGELLRIGVAEQTARQLTGDLNKEVFIPLRDEIVKGEKPAAKPSSLPQIPVPQIKAAQRPSISTKEPPASPIPPYNVINQRAPEPSAVSAVPVAPATHELAPVFRTMQHDMVALEHGAIPTLYTSGTARAMPHPSQMTPAREFQTASVPFTSIPTPSRPVDVPVSLPPAASVATHQKMPPIAPVKEHGPDPYREPI